MDRRLFLASLGISAASGLVRPLYADVFAPTSLADTPPMDSEAEFIDWGERNRGEDPRCLAQRFARFRRLVGNGDIAAEKDKRAFLMTPRESFVLKRDIERAYDHAFLEIGFGVTMSGPHVVGRKIQALDVEAGDKVLEIGTGSGYASAYLANLTEKVWTLEIIRSLEERTTGVRERLVEKGYAECKTILTKAADGYNGWEEAAPFDRIIVGCGIDHVPPPLLHQLKVGGIMVIPIGPPGAQPVFKIRKSLDKDGQISLARSDIYNGRIVPFMPFARHAENRRIARPPST